MSDVIEAIKTIRFDPAAQGDPAARTTTRDLYTDGTGTFRSGFWSSQPGKSEISYAKDELCVLLEGTVRLTDAAGHMESYTAGDTFLVPSGFKGTWENVGTVRKFFAVHKP